MKLPHFSGSGIRRATAALALSTMAIAGTPAIASAQDEAQLSAELLTLSTELAGSLEEFTGPEGAEVGSMDTGTLTETLDIATQIQGSVEAIGLERLQGIPGGIQDIIAICGKILAGQATIDELVRVVEATTAPVQPCNALTESGGQGGTYVRHELGRRGPASFTLRYETRNIPDRITVIYEGKTVFDSGVVGTNGNVHQRIDLPPGASTSILIQVVAPQSGTYWDYTVNCPV